MLIRPINYAISYPHARPRINVVAQHGTQADPLPLRSSGRLSTTLAPARNREVIMYIPPGFNTITPYFFVKGADQFVAFLVKAFGGIEVLRSLRPDGCIANTQVRIGTSTIMASEAGGQYAPMPMACYIYVENADKAMEQALAAGGTLEMEVSDMPYGDRQGGIKDPHGNIWWVSERLVHAPYST